MGIYAIINARVYITVRGSDALSSRVMATLLVFCLHAVHGGSLYYIQHHDRLGWPEAPPWDFLIVLDRDAERCKH